MIGYCAWQHSHLPSFSLTGEDHSQNCANCYSAHCFCKQKWTCIDMEILIISFWDQLLDTVTTKLLKIVSSLAWQPLFSFQVVNGRKSCWKPRSVWIKYKMNLKANAKNRRWASTCKKKKMQKWVQQIIIALNKLILNISVLYLRCFSWIFGLCLKAVLSLKDTALLQCSF